MALRVRCAVRHRWWVELWRLSESEGEEAVVVGEAQGKEDGDVRRETVTRLRYHVVSEVRLRLRCAVG